MRTSILLLTVGILGINRTEAQPNVWVNTWAGSPTRHDALGFAILEKGYVALGQNDEGDTLVDLFQYSPPDTWTEKAVFPGAKRVGATVFTLGGKAYVGMGTSASGPLNDLWVYDPGSNSWAQCSSLPGPARTMAAAFSIGSSGYISAGQDGNLAALNDLWSYDPVADAWTARASLPSGMWNASTFVVNDEAYLVASFYMGSALWHYDPVADQWSPRTAMADDYWQDVTGTIAFAQGGHGFIINMGHWDHQENPQGTFYPNRLWEYDPSADSWSLRDFFPGLPRENVASFSIDGRAYITSGSHFDPTHTVYVEPGVEYQVENVRYSLGETWSFDPSDCTGVFNGGMLPGTPCNDGNANTYADALDYYCTCMGSSQPQPNFQPDQLDNTFQTGTGFNGTVHAIAVQSDGKILAAGDFTSFNGTPNNGIARLNADGSLDAGFNGIYGGRALAIQSDGRILVGGAGIHRLMPDGSVDPSYDTFLSGIGTQSVNAIVVRPDGRIVAGGGFFHQDDEGSQFWAGLVQLLPDGSFDPSFMQNWIENVQAIVMRSDGRMVVGWAAYDQFAVNIREFDVNGSWIDWTTGHVSVGFSEPVRALTLRPEGGLVAGGEFTRYDNDHWVNNGRMRLHLAQFVDDAPYTDLDPFFDPASSTDGTIYALVAGPGGRIIAGGDFSYYRNQPHSGIVQVTRYGYADAAFNSGSGFNNGVRCFALAPDGSLLVGGLFTSYNGTPCGHITRLRTPGPLCVPSQLTTTADPVISCGAVNLKLNGTSTIATTEVPGANKYQFHFTNIAGQPAYARNIAWPTRSFTLTKWNTNPLKAGRTYNVVVRASFDDGATWCDYGPSCTVKVSWTPLVPGMEARDLEVASQDAPELLVYPNPTNGENLRLSLDGIDPEFATVTLDITDLFGERVMSATLPINDGELDTGLSLNGDLSNGVYIAHATAGSDILFGRFTLAR